jgi:hypothetical protein
MHWFTRGVVDRFAELVKDRYAVRFNDSPMLLLSQATLPERPTVVVMPTGTASP